MKRLLATLSLLAGLLCGTALVPIQKPDPAVDRKAQLEDARAAIEARLMRSPLEDVSVAAVETKRIRRITIAIASQRKNPRDDASAALSMAWQPSLKHVQAFDEIAVLVGPRYSVTCASRAFADPTISLWGEPLARTCRERRR